MDAPLLREFAPKPPLNLRWLEIARIGPYDSARGGFPLLTFGSPTGNPPRQTLELHSVIQSPGLVPDNGFTVPDLFWPVAAAGSATRPVLLLAWSFAPWSPMSLHEHASTFSKRL